MGDAQLCEGCCLAFEVLPPAHVGVFGIPGVELDLPPCYSIPVNSLVATRRKTNHERVWAIRRPKFGATTHGWESRRRVERKVLPGPVNQVVEHAHRCGSNITVQRRCSQP